MIDSLKPKPTSGDVLRKLNEIIEEINLLKKQTHEHDQELQMITDMISDQIPTSELDS